MAEIALFIQVFFERLRDEIYSVCKEFMKTENLRLAYAVVAGFVLGTGVFALLSVSVGS